MISTPGPELKTGCTGLAGNFQLLSLCNCLSGHFAVHQSPDSQRIRILQFIGERLVWKSLIADWPAKAVDGLSTHGSRSPIRRCREWAAVDHRVTDFDAGGKSIEDQASDFVFKNSDQVGPLAQVFFSTVNCRCQMSFQSASNLQDLFSRRIPHQQCRGAENLGGQIGVFQE